MQKDQSCDVVEQVAAKLQQALPQDGNLLPLHEPSFLGNEKQYLNQCVDTGYVSSIGSFVDQFEQAVADFTGAKHAIATVNGTAAIHLSLQLAGVQPGDEVFTSPFSFIATSNAIHYCHATPHFVDVDKSSLAIDANKLYDYLHRHCALKEGICYNRQTQRPIRALCVTHVFGHPADLAALHQVCQSYHLALVEDAAGALGSYYQGEHVGHYGTVGALSFNGNKLITTGGGGIVLTDDEDLARYAKHLSTTGKVAHPWRYEHNCHAYNYRMPNLNAALGCAQIEQAPGFLQAKRRLFCHYQTAFADFEFARLHTQPYYAQSNYWLNALILQQKYKQHRDSILEQCHKQGILVRPAWDLHHQSKLYDHCPRMDLSCAEDMAARIINIPSSVSLGMVEENAKRRADGDITTVT